VFIVEEEISHIGICRRRLGLTQDKLAKLSGVSQSLIAKIESGRIDPAYSKVRKIMNALDNEQKRSRSGLCAGELASRKILSLGPKDHVAQAIDLMRGKGISQIPIIDKGVCIGSISENVIVESILEYGDKLAFLTIEKVMDEAFPSVPAESKTEGIAALLKFYKAVLVSEKGTLVGIVTKADLLKSIGR